MGESQEQVRFPSWDQMRNLGPEATVRLLSQMAESLSFRRGRLYWKEATGVQHFPGGVEKKAKLGLRGRRQVTDRELGTRRAYGIPRWLREEKLLEHLKSAMQ